MSSSKNVEYKHVTVAPGTALHRALTEKVGDAAKLYKEAEEASIMLYGKENYFWMLKYSARKGEHDANSALV